MNSRSLFLSAGIAGVVIGLLSGIPFINLLNCLFCTWVWGGGIFAVYLYQRNEPAALMVKPEQGALLGAIAGVIGAVIYAIINTIFGGNATIALMFNSFIQNDAHLREVLGYNLVQLLTQGGFLILTLMCILVIFAVFGAIGGLIGSAILKPRTVPPPAM